MCIVLLGIEKSVWRRVKSSPSLLEEEAAFFFPRWQIIPLVDASEKDGNSFALWIPVFPNSYCVCVIPGQLNSGLSVQYFLDP